MPNPFNNVMFQDALQRPLVIDAPKVGTFNFEILAVKTAIYSAITAIHPE